MRTLAEVLFISGLAFACLFIFCGGSLPEFDPVFEPEPEPVAPMMMAAAKDPFDSFDNITKIGLVVNDTSSLDANYEADLYTSLNNTGASVVLIDTTTMDQATYDASALNWSSLDLVIISAFTDSAAIDTSIANGIGEVPVIVFEPFYWVKFGLPDSSGTASADSFRINGAFAFIDTTAIWAADDSLAFIELNLSRTYVTVNPPTFDNNALLLDLAGLDTVVVFDTLNTQPRIAFGIQDTNEWTDTQGAAYTFFNRCVSRLVGTYTDSLFTIGISVDVEGDPGPQSNSAFELKNHLETNGHRVILVDSDSLDKTVPNASLAWTAMNGFIFYFPATTVAEDDTVETYISHIMTMQRATADSLNLITSGATVTFDSMRTINITHQVTNGFFGLNGQRVSNLAGQQVGIEGDAESGTTILVQNFNDATHDMVVLRTNARHAFYGLTVSGFGATQTDTAWSMFNRVWGWLFSALPIQPSGFTLTAISSDSMDADWTDNSSSENGYSLFVYEPDSAYFSHLAASTTSDTIAPLWPPNTRVIADIAVISGTDTIFSSSGRDTAWTLAAVPPRVNQKLISDTELSFDINGFLFYEQFDDDNFSSNPVWTVDDGTFEIDTTRKHLRVTTTNSDLSTPFVSSIGDSLKDGEWAFDFKFSDSTANNQVAYIHIVSHKATLNDSSGYAVFLSKQATSIGITFERRETNGGATQIGTATPIGAQELYRWHTSTTQRRVLESPQDTIVTFVLYVDGDSVLAVNDETYWTTNFIGLRGSNDTRFDNITFKQLTPSANHDSTQYAVQDSVNALYVQDAADSLKAGEDWRIYSELTNGTTARDTLTLLQPDSLYVLRSKARNQYPSKN